MITEKDIILQYKAQNDMITENDFKDILSHMQIGFKIGLIRCDDDDLFIRDYLYKIKDYYRDGLELLNDMGINGYVAFQMEFNDNESWYPASCTLKLLTESDIDNLCLDEMYENDTIKEKVLKVFKIISKHWYHENKKEIIENYIN